MNVITAIDFFFTLSNNLETWNIETSLKNGEDIGVILELENLNFRLSKIILVVFHLLYKKNKEPFKTFVNT